MEGELDPAWADCFDGVVIDLENFPDGKSTTVITGRVADQAALRGILNKLWDLNLSLISVKRYDK